MIPWSNSLLSKLLSCAQAQVVCLGPRRSVCFPFTEPELCMNRQLADREEIFADKKCIGLELQTTPLKRGMCEHNRQFDRCNILTGLNNQSTQTYKISFLHIPLFRIPLPFHAEIQHILLDNSCIENG